MWAIYDPRFAGKEPDASPITIAPRIRGSGPNSRSQIRWPPRITLPALGIPHRCHVRVKVKNRPRRGNNSVIPPAREQSRVCRSSLEAPKQMQPRSFPTRQQSCLLPRQVMHGIISGNQEKANGDRSLNRRTWGCVGGPPFLSAMVRRTAFRPPTRPH